VASVHLLCSLAYFQLGQTAPAAAELKPGREMVERHFRQKLEFGDNKTGKLPGWIMPPIFLREATKLFENPPGHRPF